MKLRQIDFDVDENTGSITVQMSVPEAAFVACIVGEMNGYQQKEIMARGNEVGHEIYDCLIGAFFNKFWENGLEGALEEVGRGEPWTLDAAKKAVCEGLIRINDDGETIVPPTAIDWIGNVIVDMLVAGRILRRQ